MIWTTTISVGRTAGDDYDDAGSTSTAIDALVAHFSAPVAERIRPFQERVDMTVLTPIADIRPGDTITDRVTQERWTATASERRRGLGLDHQVTYVRRVNGVGT